MKAISMRPASRAAGAASTGAARRASGWNSRRICLACAALLAALLATTQAGCGGSSSSAATTGATSTFASSSKALWVANGSNVVEFTPTQMSVGVIAPAPHLVNGSAVFGAPQGVTFDSRGDLWVIDGGTLAAVPAGTAPPALYMFTPAQLSTLASSASPTPAVTITSASFVFPQQAVFDAAGDLWVSDNQAGAVFVFSAAQLAAATTGALAPSISITSNPAFTGPLGIAFDAAGDLFVANNGSTTLFEFLAHSLPAAAGSAVLVPDVTLSDNGSGSIQAPWGLSFDAAGNLWSSNAINPQTVVQFAAASLAVSGSPDPLVTLATATIGANQTLVAPNGVCLDNLGDLAAVASAVPFGIPVFAASQLATSGATVPATFIVGAATTLNAPAGCTYGPVVD